MFGIIYGFEVLDVTKDNWIMQGYDESDIIQHYAGWCAYRNSSWHFPLGFADKIALGTYISFTDSIPLLAIFFKVLLQLIQYDGTFQYFGIYTLYCYILQAVAAGMLMRRKSNNIGIILLTMILLCFSPILMERAFRHTALGSQWLILWALVFYFKCKDTQYKKYPAAFFALSIFAITIHPYFIPCVMIFAFIAMIEAVTKRIRIVYHIVHFALTLMICAAAGFVIGVLGTGVSPSRGGYGYFSMNLNALINPTSCGGYTWSYFLKVHEQILGNYDGFNYLGLGNLFLFALATLLMVANHKSSRSIIKNHIWFILAMIWMALFAISNVVTFNGRELFTITLPDKISELCGIFRASSRIFYPVYYCMIIYSVYYILEFVWQYNEIGKKGALIFLAGLIAIQVTDLKKVIEEKHNALDVKMEASSILDDEYLADKMSNYEQIYMLESDRRVAVCAAQNHLSILNSLANSGTYSEASNYINEQWTELENGKISEQIIWVTTNAETKEHILALNADVECYETQGYYFIFP